MKIYRQKFSLNRMYRLSDFFALFLEYAHAKSRKIQQKTAPKVDLYPCIYYITFHLPK